ncbi:MAG: amino acid adenylation domain-containing protein, partial [Verrucomicrobiota bacterium]
VGLKTVVLDVETGAAKQDLILSMIEDGGSLRVGVHYATELFDASTITRMVSHWQILLEGITANPDLRLSTLPLLTETEKRQLLSEWNCTQAEYAVDVCIHELIERHVEQSPDAVAVVFEGEQLTYRELNSRANALAHRLREHGVGPNVLVGVFVERSADMVVGLLGALKAGAAYVPLDPSLPSQRIAIILEGAQVAVLLTQQHLLERVPEQSVEIVCLDSGWVGVAPTRAENILSGVSAEDLAYVIFTSGSTGRPKGVQLSHRAVVNFLNSMCQKPGMTSKDVHLGVATMSFDASVLDFFVPLTAGACLVMVPRETVSDPLALAEALAKRDVTVMHATPATWRLLVDSGWSGSKRLRIFSGGDALPWELAQQLIARSQSLWNVYGPTETAVYSTLHKVQLDDGAVLVGRPINNTQIYILDAFLQPVPLGVPGELCIGGAGLALGYLNQPDMTAANFVPNPFERMRGARLYRTGDLARHRSDGTIECLGRIDYQIKIRGFRVELGEIEAVLAQHEAVREAVVLLREDIPGDKRLVAYVVPDQEPPPTAGQLRSFLLSKLPDYMVPSAFVQMGGLPLSSNGKVDRKALPAPTETDRRDGREYRAPTKPVEIELAEIWSRALEIERVGLTDNFFELGGHSLLAVQIVARIRDELQVDLPVRAIFDSADLSVLSARVEAALIKNQNPDDIEAIMAELEDSPET